MARGKAAKESSSRSARRTVGSKRKVAVGQEEGRSVRAKTTGPESKTKVTHPSLPKGNGSIFIFGDGDCGQLGFGEDVTERLRPAPLDVDGKKFVQVVCGGMHTAALSKDGGVYTWGVNDEGALGRPTPDKIWNESPEASEYPDRGDPYKPGLVAFPQGLDTKVVQLSAGDSHTCALMDDGSVWAWGTFRDASGVMGFSPSCRIRLVPQLVYLPGGRSSNAPAMVSIDSGADHVCALTEDGRIMSWGSGQQGQLGRVGARVSDRVKMATFLQPTVAPLKRNRKNKNARILHVSCGTYSTFLTMSDGTVYACGLNNYGQLGIEGPDIVYSFTKVDTKGCDVRRVFPGQHHTLFLSKDGALLSCGRPTYGRLGQKDADVSSDKPCPTIGLVDGLDGAIIAGAAAGLAVSGCFDENGLVWLWGFGTSNQLGKGDDDDDEVVPRKVAETKKFNGQKTVQIHFGGQHVSLLCEEKSSG